MPLTDTLIRNIKPKDKQFRMADGNSLSLLIKPCGSKYWRFRYRYNNKEKEISFGVYPIVSLKEARIKCEESRKLLREKIDPSQARQKIIAENKSKLENNFKSIALEWFESRKLSLSKSYAKDVLRRMEINLFPKLGNRTISDITAPELLEVLRVIENRGAIDIAKRTLQMIGQIFCYAISVGKLKHNIAYDLKGALKSRKKKNFSYLSEKELKEFLPKLEKYSGDILTKLAFKLLIHTFVRTNEVIGAKWSEINFEQKEWRIPEERMKMRELHVVPLSKQTIKILEELQPISGHREFLFPNQANHNRHMSNNTLLTALSRLGYRGKATVHGFRSTASTILNENGFRSDVIERQLAHAERNNVRASYNHAQYLEERREMMQWWGDYLGRIVN